MDRGRMNTNRNRRHSASEGGGAPSSPEQNGRGRQRAGADGNGPKKSWFLRHKIFTIVASVLLLTIVGGGVYFGRAVLFPESVLIIDRTANPIPTEEPTENATTADTGTPGSTATADNATPAPTEEQPPVIDFPKDIVNILMLGTDTGLGREGMGSRTDSVMLVSINIKTSKVSIISIPRDTYVKIFNEKNKLAGRNRVNATFAYGGGKDKNGIKYAMNTVSHFLGNVPIDHYVVFDMDLVIRLIRAVGGVTVDVQIKEAFTVGSIHLEPGVHKLDEYQALYYARDRHHTVGGDFGRVGHQQQVMVAVLKELKNQGKISMIPKLYQALGANVETDLSLDQIVALAWIAKGVDVDATMENGYTIPGSSMQIDGASLVIADQEKKIEILKKVFGANSGLYLKVYPDETKSYLTGIINKQFQSGQAIINSAKSLLANNKEYYSDGEAAPLKAAISAWEAAHKKNDTDGMADAQQDVQTQYDALKSIIDARKAAETEEPTETPTDEPTDAPTTEPPEPTPTPEPAPTPTPA